MNDKNLIYEILFMKDKNLIVVLSTRTYQWVIPMPN